jgi:dATP pyrophosphohydrolase
MRYRKAVFIVIYFREKNKVEYLLLKRKLHWSGWEFSKGGVRFLETREHAVKRELKEETGLDAVKIKKFDFDGKFKYDKKYSDRKGFLGQTFSLYSAEVSKKKVKLGIEHSDFKWLSFNEAIKRLKWTNQKKSLKIVNSWLKNI